MILPVCDYSNDAHVAIIAKTGKHASDILFMVVVV
jgi:hypothetical protein